MLAAYTATVCLPRAVIHKVLWYGDDFLGCFDIDLSLPRNSYPEPCNTFCLETLSYVIDSRIQRVVKDKGLLIRYIFPFSLDYGTIGVCAWILNTTVFYPDYLLCSASSGSALHCDRRYTLSLCTEDICWKRLKVFLQGREEGEIRWWVTD